MNRHTHTCQSVCIVLIHSCVEWCIMCINDVPVENDWLGDSDYFACIFWFYLRCKFYFRHLFSFKKQYISKELEKHSPL